MYDGAAFNYKCEFCGAEYTSDDDDAMEYHEDKECLINETPNKDSDAIRSNQNLSGDSTSYWNRLRTYGINR